MATYRKKADQNVEARFWGDKVTYTTAEGNEHTLPRTFFLNEYEEVPSDPEVVIVPPVEDVVAPDDATPPAVPSDDENIERAGPTPKRGK